MLHRSVYNTDAVNRCKVRAEERRPFTSKEPVRSTARILSQSDLLKRSTGSRPASGVAPTFIPALFTCQQRTVSLAQVLDTVAVIEILLQQAFFKNML